MFIRNIILTLLYLFQYNILSGQSKNVLFVGNSLTYSNEMLNTLQIMFDETKVSILVYRSCHPGMPLSDHLGIKSRKPFNSQTTEMLRSKEWYRVILQEATIRILIPEARDRLYVKAVIALDSIVKTRQGQTMLYQNYALGSYPIKYCYPGHIIDPKFSGETFCSDEFLSSYQEMLAINNGIDYLATKLNVEIAPVGDAFELFNKRYPQLNCIEGNGDTHPSEIGAYLIACVFYGRLSMKPSSEVRYYAKLQKEVAIKIQNLADEINHL